MMSTAAYIDSHFDRFVSELQRMCQQPSISTQDVGMEEMARLVQAQMQQIGLETRMLPVEGGYSVVYGALTGRTEKTILFYNHYDVQPPEPLEEWIAPPFSADIRNGTLFARGVADNKGCLLSRIHAVEAILQTYGELPVGVKFLVEGEEEVGSPHLAEFVMTNLKLLEADASVWEYAEVDEEGRPHMNLGSKGMCYVEFTLREDRQDLHSMYAPIARNPAWRLTHLLSTLRDPDGRVLIEGFYDNVKPLSPEEEQLLREMPTTPTAGGAISLAGQTDMEAKESLYGSPTCNIAGLVSGYTGRGAKTVVPSVARAKLDIRLVVDQDPDDIFEKLTAHLKKHGFDDVEARLLLKLTPFKSSVSHAFVRTAARTGVKVYGQQMVIEPTIPASGPRYAAGLPLGIPVVGLGVAHSGSNIHAPNENIRLNDYRLGTKHIASLIEEFGAE